MRTDLLHRFESSFIPEPMSGCWLWERTVGQNGYGKMKVDGKMIGAHRASYMIYIGEIDKGMSILHSCDNPICVNPSHLRPGTHAQNMKDGTERNRFNRWGGRRRGSGNPNAKLTPDIVMGIYRSTAKTSDIADMLGIHNSTVSKIRLGRTWSHLTGHIAEEP